MFRFSKLQINAIREQFFRNIGLSLSSSLAHFFKFKRRIYQVAPFTHRVFSHNRSRLRTVSAEEVRNNNTQASGGKRVNDDRDGLVLILNPLLGYYFNIAAAGSACSVMFFLCSSEVRIPKAAAVPATRICGSCLWGCIVPVSEVVLIEEILNARW